MTLLSHLDDYAGWLAVMVAGLAALGWLLKKSLNGLRRAADIARKIDTLEALASYELTHNSGHSIKDHIAKIPVIESRLTIVEATLSTHLNRSPQTNVYVRSEGAPSATETNEQAI